MPRVLVDLLQYTGKKGGMEVYIRELYREFGLRDTEFEFMGLASRELMDLDRSWFPGPMIASGISGENRVAWAIGELVHVSAAARRTGADLIHCPAMLGPAWSRAPVVITSHDLLYFTHPELMSTRRYTEPVKLMERVAARHASRMITISRWSEQHILRYLNVPSDRIDVIPLAGTRRTQRPTRTARATDSFLAVGQRRPHKNFDTILEAFALIPAARRPRLTITGSYDEDPLRAVADRLGLGDHVRLLGWIDRDELEDLFAESTALIDASFATGFGMPTLEAMLDGLPVILADTPVFREVGGDAPEYFDPLDPTALAEIIERVRVHPETLTRMSEEGAHRASGFSWARVADGTLDSFRAALADPR